MKYQNTAEVGDRIRSYDFQGRTDAYIEGEVLAKGVVGEQQGYACFVVRVDVDVWPGKVGKGREGSRVFVPMECAYMEYEGRIVNLSHQTP